MALTKQQKAEIIKNNPELRSWIENMDMLMSKISVVLGEDEDMVKTPVKGVDYFTPQEVAEFIKAATPKRGIHYFHKNEVSDFLKAVTPRKGVDYFDGEKGKDYILTQMDKKEIASMIDVPVVEKVIEKIEKQIIQPNPDMNIEKILEAIMKELKNPKSKHRLSKKDINMPEDNPLDQRWGGHGGGGGGLSAQKSEKSFTIPNGVTTTFLFAHNANIIMWNGQFQFINEDYTANGSSITFTASAGIPQPNDKIINLYV